MFYLPKRHELLEQCIKATQQGALFSGAECTVGPRELFETKLPYFFEATAAAAALKNFPLLLLLQGISSSRTFHEYDVLSSVRCYTRAHSVQHAAEELHAPSFLLRITCCILAIRGSSCGSAAGR